MKTGRLHLTSTEIAQIDRENGLHFAIQRAQEKVKGYTLSIQEYSNSSDSDLRQTASRIRKVWEMELDSLEQELAELYG